MMLRLRKAFAHVKEMAKNSKEKSHAQYNKKATSCLIQPGDLVLLRNETGTGETQTAWPTRYIGPYRVLERNKNNFKIAGVYADKRIQNVHVNRLKLAHLLPNNAYPFNNHNEENRSDENNTDAAEPTQPMPVNDNVTQDQPVVSLEPIMTQQTADQSNTIAPPHRYNLRNRR